ncbi:DoxX family protein [uncultured Corynebacterium sp.]|uniref:DoxX family protein n=1 Tax=uncultured Corynebacterium sp. TaxID=159447 RepID=UPI0025FCA622|nr:DoxX family protein [uncultured Corynebacterium sp.]
MSTIKEIALLLSRVLFGVILIAHGWDKFQITGLEGITGYFDSLGIPAASLAAPAVGVIELIGGIMILLGAFTRVVAVIIAVVMLGAAVFAHASFGIYAANGGWELVGAIGAGMLALFAIGAGAWSIDALIARNKSTTAADEKQLITA